MTPMTTTGPKTFADLGLSEPVLRALADCGYQEPTPIQLAAIPLVSARREGDRWVCQLRDTDSGEEFTTTARVVVNAAGPFVDELNTSWGLTTDHRIVYSKGIHLIVPRLTTTRHNRVLAFFDDTQRLFYVIPMGRRSVIGTTDTRVDDPHTQVTDEDRDFLLAQINARLDLPAPLPPGAYRLVTGWYDPVSGERVPAASSF